VEIVRLGGQYKPQLRIEEIEGRLAFVKDFSPCGRWFRRLIGRWLVGREQQALEAAEGLPGVPRVVARLGPYALAVEHVGRTAVSLEPSELAPDFWEQLEAIVRGLHARGIAHGDLKTLENVLIDGNGRVFLVDFNSAILRDRGLVQRILYPHIRTDDRRALVKAKLLLEPHLVTEEERAFYDHRSTAERVFRRLRRPIRRFIKRLAGRPVDDREMRPSVRLKRQREGERSGE
jgi:hypothetical protein